jgi:integrase
MATIAKRQTEMGEHRYDVRYRDLSGRQRTKTFKRRKDADQYMRTVEAELVQRTWIDPTAGRVVFAEYAAAWVDQRTTTRGRLAPRTVELYRQQLASHIVPTFGPLELNRITSTVVRGWYADLVGTGHQVSAAKAYRLLRAILATSVADELILRNPCAIKGAGIERSAERSVATPAEVWAVADAMPDYLRAFVLTGAFAGLRFSEAAALSRRHVDLLHRTITVERQLERVGPATAKHLGISREAFGPPKTDAGYRVLSIPGPLLVELEGHLAAYSAPGPDGLVFVDPRGATISRGLFSRRWADARRTAGLEAGFRFHDLRHTHMTSAAESVACW